jgi:hypothetical protein
MKERSSEASTLEESLPISIKESTVQIECELVERSLFPLNFPMTRGSFQNQIHQTQRAQRFDFFQLSAPFLLPFLSTAREIPDPFAL